MDGVKEARQAFKPLYEQWLSTEAAQMFGAAQTLGLIEEIPSGVRRTIASGTTTVAQATRSRSGTTGTRRRRGRSAGGGKVVTGSQVIAFLQEHGPQNQSAIAQHFGTTRQTIAKRLSEAGSAVEKDGQSWRAAALTPA